MGAVAGQGAFLRFGDSVAAVVSDGGQFDLGLRGQLIAFRLADIYNSPYNDESHGFLIPFVVLYLFWWKREELADVDKRNWAAGLGILVIAAALHVIGYVVQQARLSVIALFLGLYGIMGIVWGRAFLRVSFFPFAPEDHSDAVDRW